MNIANNTNQHNTTNITHNKNNNTWQTIHATQTVISGKPFILPKEGSLCLRKTKEMITCHNVVVFHSAIRNEIRYYY